MNKTCDMIAEWSGCVLCDCMLYLRNHLANIGKISEYNANNTEAQRVILLTKDFSNIQKFVAGEKV
jgi:NADPH-dependent curcumin reductase CurA